MGEYTTVAFISGHRDATIEEFQKYYMMRINDAVLKGCSFVVSNYEGIDTMAQVYLRSLMVEHVIVFHMYNKLDGILDGFDHRGGFLTDDDRDEAMMLLSDFDIAWVRDGKEKSGTAQNIQRRIKHDELINDMDGEI